MADTKISWGSTQNDAQEHRNFLKTKPFVFSRKTMNAAFVMIKTVNNQSLAELV